MFACGVKVRFKQPPAASGFPGHVVAPGEAPRSTLETCRYPMAALDRLLLWDDEHEVYARHAWSMASLC
jgi:hypothetical protein